MFNLKRNQVIITVLVFMIAIAAYLNTQEPGSNLPMNLVDNTTFNAENLPEEEDFLVYKTNAGADQENIKFPESYRKKLNEFLINALGAEWFDLEVVHLNSCIEQK